MRQRTAPSLTVARQAGSCPAIRRAWQPMPRAGTNPMATQLQCRCDAVPGGAWRDSLKKNQNKNAFLFGGTLRRLPLAHPVPAIAMPSHADLDRPHAVEGTYATKTTRTGSTPKNAPKLTVSLLA